ncbi:hypothetical protein ACLESD_18555, partial [Pyxidicoccus sp. 3LFB2]
ITQPLADALPATLLSPGGNPGAPNAANVLAALGQLVGEGQGTRLTLSLGAELGELGKTQAAHEVNNVSFTAIGQVESAYVDARSAREAADAELAAQLGELEGVLTPEQQQAYIEEYRRLNEAVYRTEAEAAQRLDAVVAPNVGLIDQAVLYDRTRAEQVVGVMSTLAGSPLPAAATEWGINAFQDDSETAEVYAQYRDQVRTEVVERGLPGTLTQYQAEGGDANAALDKWNTLYNGVKTARDLFTSASQHQDAINAGAEFINASRAWLNGDPSVLTNLLNRPGAVESLSPFGAAFAAAGVAFGVVNAANAEDVEDLAKALGEVSKAGLELFAGAVNSLSNSGRLALLAGQTAANEADRAASFATQRLIPGLGVAINAIATVDAFKEAVNDPSLANVVAVVGNATALLGSAISLFPALLPVGKLVEAIGSAISVFAEAFLGDGDDQRNMEQQQILEKVLKDHYHFRQHPEQLAEVAERLANNEAIYDDIWRNADLSKAQLYELIYRTGDDPRSGLKDIVDAALAVGLEGNALVDAIAELAEERGNVGEAYLDVIRQFEAMKNTQPLSEEQRQGWLRQIAELLGLEGPDSD